MEKQKTDSTIHALIEKPDEFWDEPQDYYENHGLWTPDKQKPNKITEELFKKLEKEWKKNQ